MSSLPLLLLLLCLSLHACTFHPLILSQIQTAKCHSYKDLDTVLVLDKCIAASKQGPCTLEENKVQQGKVAHDETVGTGLSNRHSGATTSLQTDSPSLLLRRHTRSMLGPAQHHVTETVNPSSGDTMEDMVEMDYAQPHRKPPIHNEKP
ncbi:uncharacterized protein LOC129321319 isoform X2 [Prosopis cineraria]|uniref:uncharacterized protein LOC129321319 isoform X2 n=1 Tax=Prosopis cineraria TaxID=364024 RepID=UPI00240F5082|nr:uncharacterized protein LOC129321319 isoform X2 [Prosopis cineraria]